MTREKSYVAIDLKSFYASVECVERGLDPLNTNLVVADERRSEKTICLAVSPSLKQYGIPGRPRLFEVVQKVKEINRDRERRSPLGYLSGNLMRMMRSARILCWRSLISSRSRAWRFTWHTASRSMRSI